MALNSLHLPRPLRRPYALRAFTLFELTLVLLIIGIAAAAIVPAIGNNIRSPRLKAAANVLAADIDLCASECIARPGSPRAITFDTTHNSYSLIDINAGTPIKHPSDGLPFNNDFATGRNSQLAGVTVTALTMGSGTLSTLTFDVYGKPLITADFVITLSYNGQSLKVTVKNLTGDVSISG
jgi:Tfp pilus assembly protein FimT